MNEQKARYEVRFIGTAGTWYVFDTQTQEQTPLGPADKLMSVEEMAAGLNERDALRLRVSQLEAALKPFGEMWSAWLSEREKSDTPFLTFSRFVAHKTGMDINPFRDAHAALQPDTQRDASDEQVAP